MEGHMSETGGQDPAAGANEPAPAKEATRQTTPREHLDELLDEALEETFPASDPIAVHEQLRKDAPPR
jgi:hypothetical protein